MASGTVEISFAQRTHRLGQGDAIQLEADLPHAYANGGDQEAQMYLVMTYAEPPVDAPEAADLT